MTYGNLFNFNQVILHEEVLNLQTEKYDKNLRKYNEKRSNFIETFEAKKAVYDAVV